jgi:hypothetical protein
MKKILLIWTLLFTTQVSLTANWLSQYPTEQWSSSDWFGSFFKVNENWLYHNQHGFQYSNNSDGNWEWFWDFQFGWYGTSASVYPWLYLKRHREWILFFRKTEDARQYFSTENGWVAIDDYNKPGNFLIYQTLQGEFTSTQQGTEIKETFGSNGAYQRLFIVSGISWTAKGHFNYLPSYYEKVASLNITYNEYLLTGEGVSFKGSPEVLAEALGQAVPLSFELNLEFLDQTTVRISGRLFYSDNSSIQLAPVIQTNFGK